MHAPRTVTVTLCLAVLLSCLPCRAQESLTPFGKRFFKEAASLNQMEMQLGSLARDRGGLAEIREYGARLTAEHGTAQEELGRLAAANNVKLPRQVERKHLGQIASLAKFSGREFDRRFLQAMVSDHKKSIDRFKKAQRRLDDADLKAYGARYLPVLEKHLARARELVRVVGVP